MQNSVQNSRTALQDAFSNAVRHVNVLMGAQALSEEGLGEHDIQDAHRIAAVMDGLRGAIEAERAGLITISEHDRIVMTTTLRRIVQPAAEGLQ